MAKNVERYDKRRTERLKNELRRVNAEKSLAYSIKPKDNSDLREWEVIISGPENSPYSGDIFHLSYQIPDRYPSQAPKIVFNSKILHPNVDENGVLHLGDLWRAAYGIVFLTLLIKNLLEDPHHTETVLGYERITHDTENGIKKEESAVVEPTIEETNTEEEVGKFTEDN